ncbi:S16 family serine protease [Aliagarivorans taiwanensis]|uniref:S16 family serine protease n=1 Tax=Aliagarivorans taiwanensis TaxID=561966 RepID=UPI0004106722|nr:S16 family serine protease [Aliagarivorans taiwanensis]
MYTTQLQAEQLNPALPTPERSSTNHWRKLLPQAAESLDYFATQASGYMLIQGPSALPYKDIIEQLYSFERVTSQALFVIDYAPHCALTLSCAAHNASQLKSGLSNVYNAIVDQDAAASLSREYPSDTTIEGPQELTLAHQGLSLLLDDSQQPLLNKLIQQWQQHVGWLEAKPVSAYYQVHYTTERVAELSHSNPRFSYGRIGHGEHGTVRPGALLLAHRGLLLVDADVILATPHSWRNIKHCIQSGLFDWCLAEREQQSAYEVDSAIVELKVIIHGDPLAIANLREGDPVLYEHALVKVELPNDVALNSENAGALVALCEQRCGVSALEQEDIASLLRYASRLSENNLQLSLELCELCKPLEWMSQHEGVGYQQALVKLESFAQLQMAYSNQGFNERQIKLWVDGEQLGQVNGLSVIDFDTIGESFGEPLRITATIQQGDGDISDVERKSELGGNIHAKSMMIIQGFLNNQFASEHHFPLSGNVVFEQSYHEIDGDSASLAGLISVLSALSRVAVRQSLSITGALDQHGHVLAVGGINEKIEGFYRVCKLLGINGQQGVIIPKANLGQLNLQQDVVDAVREQRFAIHVVDHVSEAIPLLLNKPAGSNDDPDSIYGIIHKRVVEDDEAPSIWQKLLDTFTALFNQRG